MLSKEFPGGILVLTGANSAVGLRSMPARFLFLDEVDAYPGDIEGEGDPIALAEARARTFGWRRKAFLVSTPTIAGRSRIEREYAASDQRRYFLPCPHCGAMQWLKFERLIWEKGEAFTRFLSDGRICLTNNAAERMLRGAALGRKAWLFAGSDQGGERAAAMYSLIQTAKLNGVDPRAWLADVLAVSPICRSRDFMNCCLGIGKSSKTWRPVRREDQKAVRFGGWLHITGADRNINRHRRKVGVRQRLL